MFPPTPKDLYVPSVYSVMSTAAPGKREQEPLLVCCIGMFKQHNSKTLNRCQKNPLRGKNSAQCIQALTIDVDERAQAPASNEKLTSLALVQGRFA